MIFQIQQHESARKQSEENHVSEMQSAKVQIARMQQLIDGASQRELQQLTEVEHSFVRTQ